MHEAAREGSLLALQQALDRRKFAIAKDDISPNGATPLHVAVLFGNTGELFYTYELIFGQFEYIFGSRLKIKIMLKIYNTYL